MSEENYDDYIISDEEQGDTPLIYCGPSLPKYGLSRFQVYAGKIPYNVKQAIEVIPEIEKLIVPYQELDVMRGKIAHRGTPEYEYYQAVSMKILAP